MKVILIIMVFLLMNAFFIISNNSLSLKEEGNIGKLYDLYTSWLGKVVDNLAKITGEIVRLDWVAQEDSSTNSIKSNIKVVNK